MMGREANRDDGRRRAAFGLALRACVLCAALAGLSAAAWAQGAPQAPPAAGEARPGLADSVRREAGRLAALGRLDDAQRLVERHASDLSPAWRAMFAGKLEADGEAASRGYAGAAAQGAPVQMRGEAVFRTGQYHYAAERYHLAIPQFRQYLAEHPEGTWSQESAYWMAHSCLQLVWQQPARAAYLDTALSYLKRLEDKGTRAYYWPLGRMAQARAHLMRGDTVSAAHALRDARARAPAEETPGLLLLSLQTEPRAAQAAAWEDSLRWTYPLSPEAQSLPRPVSRETSPPPSSSPPSAPAPSTAAKGTHMLQLGAFAQKENADRLHAELAAKRIAARVEPLRVGNRQLYRVVTGDYADAVSAQSEGKRLLDPLGYSFRVVARE